MTIAISHRAAAIAALTLFAFSDANAASDPTGIWMNDTGRGAVEIKPCGKALCGHVVAVKSDSDSKGCGRQIIGDAQSVGGGRWDNGWIYSPEKRRNYDVELKPQSDGTLRVVGYAGTKLFSRTMIWTRAPADLKRCDTIAVKPAAAPVPAPGAAKDVVKAGEAAPAKPPAAAPSSAAAAPQKSVPADAAPAPPANSPARDGIAQTDQPAAAGMTAKAPAAPTAPAGAPGAAGKDPPSHETAADTQIETAGQGDGDAPGGGTVESDGGSGLPDLENLDLKNLKLGDLKLEQVLKRTKSGACKLDLPWIKVQFDCQR